MIYKKKIPCTKISGIKERKYDVCYIIAYNFAIKHNFFKFFNSLCKENNINSYLPIKYYSKKMFKKKFFSLIGNRFDKNTERNNLYFSDNNNDNVNFFKKIGMNSIEITIEDYSLFNKEDFSHLFSIFYNNIEKYIDFSKIISIDYPYFINNIFIKEEDEEGFNFEIEIISLVREYDFIHFISNEYIYFDDENISIINRKFECLFDDLVFPSIIYNDSEKRIYVTPFFLNQNELLLSKEDFSYLCERIKYLDEIDYESNEFIETQIKEAIERNKKKYIIMYNHKIDEYL